MDGDERYNRLAVLAGDVLRLTRNTLLLNLRFLDSALSRLDYEPNPMIEFATDGESLIFNPGYVLQRFVTESEAVTRDYLHAVFHCVFRHMFIDSLVDRECWNLACDIAVEYSLSQLDLKPIQTEREEEQKRAFSQLEDEGVSMTAERLYRTLLDQQFTQEEMDYFRGLFYADDHTVWYIDRSGDDDLQNGQSGQNDDDNKNQNSDKNNNSGDGDGDSDGGENDENNSRSGSGGEDSGDEASDEETLSVEQDWREVSQRMQMELETFARQQGEKAGALVQNLAEVNREKYDYAAFLKKFAVPGEAMQINDDEFDYIYYTYGLQLYGKMPLVEPLEYKEVKRIREFIIAIDTSGSTSGALVQSFLNKTYNILMQEESYFSKINIHIIQCDSEIQEDVKITERSEFERYLSTMQLRGQGGTDFRPVFEYVETLRRQKEFVNLKGLIYFTDGFGTFPQRKPDYETAFVFLDSGYNNPDIPAWAIKLVLAAEDI